MTDTQTLNEHQLSAMAAKMRNAIGPADGLPQYLREALADAADTFDYAAEGKRDQSAVQSAVDRLNKCWERQMLEAWHAFDTAEAGDDPEAWRDSLLNVIALLPPDLLGVVKDAFVIVLEHMLADAVKDFECMPAASETRQ